MSAHQRVCVGACAREPLHNEARQGVPRKPTEKIITRRELKSVGVAGVDTSTMVTLETWCAATTSFFVDGSLYSQSTSIGMSRNLNTNGREEA